MERSPLYIYCRSCGAPAGFDIIHQTYRCPNCSETTGLEEAKKEEYSWHALQKKNNSEQTVDLNAQETECPACGAKVLFAQGEASETCDFCGNRLIRRSFKNASQLPELIIPFFLTPEEAETRMREWGKKHRLKPEGRAVLNSMDRLRGYYLPYRLVRGPVHADVSRDDGKRIYHCAGYLDGTAVSTSKQLDNLVLNEAEPFDWTKARPFELAYIAGTNVKLNDLSDAEIDRRIRQETERDFLPEVEKVLQTSGVDISTMTGDMITLSALMPMYVIRNGKLTAAVNGQTGRISASLEREKKTYPWVIEPAFWTILLTAVMTALIPSAEMAFYGGMVFACIIFSVMSEGRTSLVRSVILRSRTSRAEREADRLVIKEGRDALRNPYDNTPVFFESNKNGEQVPVKIRFYSVGRWLGILVRTLILVFLPAVLAAPLRLASMEEGERFLDGFHMGYGGAWYVLAGFIALLYFIKGVRRDIYDHPLIYEFRGDGKLKLTGKRADRKVGILSMFGFGEIDDKGHRFTVIDFIKDGGALAFWLLFGLFVILIGSTAAIVF